MSEPKLKFVKRAQVEEKQKVLDEIELAEYSQEVSLCRILAQKIAIKYPHKIDELIRELRAEAC
jgi:hypothetical protein